MKKKITAGIVFVILDIILLAVFVSPFHNIFWHIFRSDFIEYENWYGTLDQTIKYRFGAGSAEITLIVLKTIGFVIAQCKLLKEQPKALRGIFISLHVVLGILGLFYCFAYADGAEIIYNIKCLLQG